MQVLGERPMMRRCPRRSFKGLAKALDAIITQPEFRGRLARYPASAVASPHLFEKVAVPGICVA
jgi:hypothetical protein